MIRSMTGYGRAQEQIHGREISVELKSVNNRYLDCSVKLPGLYSFAVEPVKARIRQTVFRGRVDAFITVQNVDAVQTEVLVNRPVLEGYLAALRQIAEEYGVQDDITVTELSRLPDVLTVQKQEENEAEVQADLLHVLDLALEHFNAMRAAEGAAMEADIRSRAASILDMTARIEARSPETVAEYRARLTRKLQEVLENTALDESRILTEAAIYADRIAVDEETVRLRSHLSQLNSMLDAGGSVGRKLDFLLQELNREANTIGSKCSDVALSEIVVDMKAELEKIREQIQNLE